MFATTHVLMMPKLCPFSLLQALMKKSRGFDHFAIAWEYPGQYREVIHADFSRTTRPNIDHNS
jgi:hypothetical protein